MYRVTSQIPKVLSKSPIFKTPSSSFKTTSSFWGVKKTPADIATFNPVKNHETSLPAQKDPKLKELISNVDNSMRKLEKAADELGSALEEFERNTFTPF